MEDSLHHSSFPSFSLPLLSPSPSVSCLSLSVAPVSLSLPSHSPVSLAPFSAWHQMGNTWLPGMRPNPSLSLRLWLRCLHIWCGSDVRADRETGGRLAAVAAKRWKKRQPCRRRGRGGRLQANRSYREHRGRYKRYRRERCVLVVFKKRSHILSHYLMQPIKGLL